MKTKRTMLWVVGIIAIIILFSLYTILASVKSVDQVRRYYDTSFFTGTHPAFAEPAQRTGIMKTSAYQKFLTTKNRDSLLIYLKLAEKESVDSFGKK